MRGGKRVAGGRWARAGLLGLAMALTLAALGTFSAPALAQGSGYYVTFVARYCPSYTDIFANKQRNDIMETLQDLGPDTQYTDPSVLINPTYEDLPPQNLCSPLPGWKFTLGTGYQSRAVTGVWGSLSKVTDPFDTSIQTQAQTPLLDQNAVPVDHQTIAGATTIELTPAEREQATNRDQLWTQGGVPADPVLTADFPGPEYAFGALRCATDDLNGDNVEYIYFPTGVTHVFCYGLYVRPAPTAGIITIRKQVTGAPSGENPSFPFNGTISYDPSGFQLGNGGSEDFYRAGGDTWTVTEGSVQSYRLRSIACTATTADGGPGQSTTTVTGATAAVHLVAGEHVTCVYDNAYVPPPGNLTVEKISRGGVGTFSYVVASLHGGRPRVLRAQTTQVSVPAVAAPALPTLNPGVYTIAERAPASQDGRWVPVSVTCNGMRRLVTRLVRVTIATGQSTTCTFVNTFVPRGSISLAKTTYGATGAVAFVVSSRGPRPVQYLQHATTTSPGVPAGAAPSTPADATDHLALGRYLITEQSPPSDPADAWALTSVDCNGVLQPFTTGTVGVVLTRRQPNVHCVFSDTFTPSPPPIPPEPPAPPIPPPPTPPPPVTPPDALPSYALSDLAVSKHALSAVAVRGHSVSYRITVRNLGPDPAQRVILDDQPLGRARIVGVHTPVGSCRRPSQVVCELGTLTAGHSVLVTVRLIPTGTASHLTNRAVVGTGTAERTLANNTAEATIRVIAPAPPPPGRG